MPLPPQHPIEFTAGDRLKFAFKIVDKDLDDPDDPGTPRNLTGCSVLAQVRQTPTSPEVLAEWTLTAPLDDTGVIRMKIPGPETQAWAAIQQMVSDVQITDTEGDPDTVLRINITAANDVSREEVTP